MSFRYFQLRHALRAQLQEPIMLEPDQIERLLISRLLEGQLSSFYLRLAVTYAQTTNKSFDRWQNGIPNITTEDWEDCTGSYIMNMISARDRFM